MAPRQGHPIHGWINIDKPKGISSAKVVAIVRRALDAAKAGHGGTLDPLATGVLPIALGEATKTVSFAMKQQKSYEFELAWGSETSTDDGEGQITRVSDHRPAADVRGAGLGIFLLEYTADRHVGYPAGAGRRTAGSLGHGLEPDHPVAVWSVRPVRYRGQQLDHPGQLLPGPAQTRAGGERCAQRGRRAAPARSAADLADHHRRPAAAAVRDLAAGPVPDSDGHLHRLRPRLLDPAGAAGGAGAAVAAGCANLQSSASSEQLLHVEK